MKTRLFKSLSQVQDQAALLAKIKERIEIDKNGCHIWSRGLDFAGYGMVSFEGRTWSTHRLMYQFTNGPITEAQQGLFVLHQCDVPACCNPEHLTLGTPAQNNREAADRCRKRYGHRIGSPISPDCRIGTVFYEYRGEIKSLNEWAAQFDLNISTLDARFLKGLPEEAIPLQPKVGRRNPNNVVKYRRFSGIREVEEYLAEKAKMNE